MRLKSIPVLLVLFLLAGAAPLGAGIVYSNFGPGDSYNSGAGWTIGHPDLRMDQGHAFTPVSSFTLGQIDFALGLASGTNQAELWLMSDAGGEPGSVIESFSFTGTMGAFGDLNPPLSATSVLQPELLAGVQYWIIASAPVEDTWAAWNLNDQGATGLHASRQFGGAWALTSDDALGAFRIQDAAIPEPGTFLLLLGGLGLLVCRRLSAR